MNRRSNHTSIAGGMLALLALLAISTSAFAQLPGVGGVPAYAPPFDMIGFMQDAGLGAPGARGTYSANARTQAGWMVINNHMITVPQNTVLQMPATSMTWADLFDPAGPAAVGPTGPVASPYGGDVTAGGTRTGMAMIDPLKLPGTYEVHVQGNIVNGTYIAGLIFIAPQSLNTGNGFVSRIDYTTGAIYVNGGPGGTETKLLVNDPIGRFGLAHSPDQRFTIDEDNPTIHAETGYPMCVPRFDPAVRIDNLCPQINRPPNPLGGYLMNFTMPDPRTRTATQSDAYLMAPFEIGDYLTYAGMLVPDATQTTGYYISVYNIDANVGIYTAPLTDPVYVVIGEFEQGTGGVANVAFPQETTSRVKVEGMSTDSDPGRGVNIGARDTDCNGIVTDRASWISAFPIDPGPPTGAKRGRIRWRTNGGPFLPPAKEIHVIATGANTATPTKNGLFPGQYFAPEFGFIFPENLGVGDPPVTLNLSDFVWLVNGIGPFGTDAAGNPVVVGQLAPFPDMNAPVATCNFNATTANSVVTADAGGPYTINLDAAGNGSVALAGAAAVPAGANASYLWTVLNQQTGTSTLFLDGRGLPTPTTSTNQNPTASIRGLLGLTTPITFQLSLVAANTADPTHPSTAAVTTVTVNPAVQPPVISSLVLSPSTLNINGTFTATANAFDPGGSALTYIFNAPCATVSGAQPQTSNVATFTAGAAPATCTVSVTATNASGQTATKFATVVIQAPAGAPSITSVKATPNPVVSNGSVALSAVVSNPTGIPLTYAWTITNTSVVPNTVINLTGATPTFTAPTVTAAQGTNSLTVKLVVSNANGASTPVSTILTVTGPPADTLANNGTLYRTSKSRLTVNVTSSVVSPSIVVTAVLDLINPATGQHYAGTLQNLGGGAYTLDFIGVGLPNSITVTSTGGGTLTITQAQISVRQ